MVLKRPVKRTVFNTIWSCVNVANSAWTYLPPTTRPTFNVHHWYKTSWLQWLIDLVDSIMTLPIRSYVFVHGSTIALILIFFINLSRLLTMESTSSGSVPKSTLAKDALRLEWLRTRKKKFSTTQSWSEYSQCVLRPPNDWRDLCTKRGWRNEP